MAHDPLQFQQRQSGSSRGCRQPSGAANGIDMLRFSFDSSVDRLFLGGEG